ncbi:MAG TPA: hypothetical protein VGJ42_01240 [Nitrososphaera sp.]
MSELDFLRSYTSLPAEKRMALPSLITRDYVSRAVDIIEETTYSSYKN